MRIKKGSFINDVEVLLAISRWHTLWENALRIKDLFDMKTDNTANHVETYEEYESATVIFRRTSIPAASLFIYSAIIILLALFQVADRNLANEDWPMQITILATIWLAFYLFASYAAFRTFYLFSNAYILALILFHLTIPLMVAFGLIDYDAWTIGDFSKWVAKAAWFLILALGSYGIGASICLTQGENALGIDPDNPIALDSKRFVRLQAYGLLLAALMLLILAFLSYGNVLEYKRQELYESGADSRGLKVFMMVFPGATMALALGAASKPQRYFGYGLATFSILLFMLTGYRSAALFAALVGAVVWVKSGRKIPNLVAVSLVAIVLISISVIGIFRQMAAYNELTTEDLQASYEAASFERSIVEMGQALGVAAHVFRLVPEHYDYILGGSYVKAFKEMLPNLMPTMDKTNARSTLGEKLKSGDNDVITEMQPSDWLTYEIKRDQFDRGGGVGFSALAEPYLNFGVAGVVMFFFSIGYLLIRLDKTDLLYNRYAYIFAAAMIWPLMRTVRNDFSNFLKPLGFLILILITWNLCVRLMPRRL
jgi:oligosaccharide repeat unit polymerase